MQEYMNRYIYKEDIHIEECIYKKDIYIQRDIHVEKKRYADKYIYGGIHKRRRERQHIYEEIYNQKYIRGGIYI